MNNEQILTESKTARENTIKEITNKRTNEIFTKVKGLVLLPDNINTTVEMTANYFEVDKKLIEYHIKQNKDELLSDGLKVLKGKELKDFKGYLAELGDLDSKIKASPTLTLIPRRAILRLGMLIQKSEIAKQIRTYLLNVEENTSNDDRLFALSKLTNNKVNILERKIDKLTEQNDNIKKQNNIIVTNNEELKYNNTRLINKVDELLNMPLFKLYVNQSNSYETLITEFAEIMHDKGEYSASRYVLFNKEFSNWTGHEFKVKTNKKSYWLGKYGLDIIKQFIYGIKQGVIVKNKYGNWLDLNGIYNNKIEWKKVLQEFNYECCYCGKNKSDILLPEHIIPQTSENTTNMLYNLVPACPECNSEKDTMKMSEWLEYRHVTQERIEKLRIHWDKYYFKK